MAVCTAWEAGKTILLLQKFNTKKCTHAQFNSFRSSAAATLLPWSGMTAVMTANIKMYHYCGHKVFQMLECTFQATLTQYGSIKHKGNNQSIANLL